MASKQTKEAAIASSILELVRGVLDEKIQELIVSKHGIALDDAGLIIIEAKKRIQLAADWNRNEQLGLAIKRLNRILELSLPEEDELGGDLQVAARAQVELNKLLKLHEIPAGSGGDPDEPGTDNADELERVREHLGGVLEGYADDYPVSELARIAANQLREADAQN